MNRRGVDYLIVGGYAVAYHGAPRVTGDIDMFVRPAAENYARLLQALHDFGFPVEGLDPGYLAAQRKILQPDSRRWTAQASLSPQSHRPIQEGLPGRTAASCTRHLSRAL